MGLPAEREEGTGVRSLRGPETALWLPHCPSLGPSTLQGLLLSSDRVPVLSSRPPETLLSPLTF